LDFTKGLLEGDLSNSLHLDLAENGMRKTEEDGLISDCFSLIGLVKDMETVQQGRDFRAELQERLSSLQRQIDAYDAELASIAGNLDEMQAMRDGVTQACSDAVAEHQ